MKDINKFFTDIKAASSTPELATEWAKVEDLYSKKLWHQLTLALNKLVKEPSLAKHLPTIYDEFITDFESRLDPLALALLGEVVVGEYSDAEEALAFIERLAERVKQNTEAKALAKVLQGRVRLHKLQQQKEAKEIIEEVDTLLSSVDGVSPVHSHFYRLASELYRIQGKHAEFYRSSLRFLGCTPLSQLSGEEQVQQATFLSLSALLGDKVYNFGELLAHPVLSSLAGTDSAWLVELLHTFNSGDVAKFRAMKPKWSTQPDLLAAEGLLFEKVCLLCLMEMTFRREANQRQVKFSEIAEATTLPVDQVELLIMKCLAQGLIKGKINEVSGVVALTWVQPRVLDTTQLQVMVGKIDTWANSVASMESLIENKAGEILTY